MSNAGTILRIDLTDRKIEKEPTSSYIKNYIGGLSIGMKLFWEGVPPEITGLDPKNMLIFSTGPLTGTLLGNKALVIAKSPLYTNQTVGNTGFGGQFPSEMKFAGYDHIAITGKAERPVYLFIHDDEVEFRDAVHLWGMDVFQTQAAIKEDLQDPEVQVAAIGPAGENQVAGAMIVHDIDNTAAKGGHGGVMGSKRLKAVAVRGTKGLRIADPETFMSLWQKYYEYYTEGRGGFAFKTINDIGIARQADAVVEMDVAAWGYFDSYVVPNKDKAEKLLDYMKKHRVGSVGCAFCPAQCHTNLDAAGVGGGVHCWALAGFQWIVKNQNKDMWWRCHMLCQRYGLEMNEAAGTTAWLMKLHELGIITAADTDGIPMEWGSEEACVAVIEKMSKREGFGELIADGTIEAGKRIGKKSIKHAIQAYNKQVYPATGMPIGASAGTYMIPAASEVWLHPPSADKDYVFPFMATAMDVSNEEGERITDGWTSDHAEKTTGYRDAWEEFNWEHYADYAVVNEAAISACDISGHCDWLSDRMPHYGFQWSPEDNAKAMSAATGLNITGDMVVDAHKRRRLLELTHIRLCFHAFGEKLELPMKLLMPIPDGRSKGSKMDMGKIPMVSQRYCELMGINPETQLPTKKELERLGLKDVIDAVNSRNLKEKIV